MWHVMYLQLIFFPRISGHYYQTKGNLSSSHRKVVMCLSSEYCCTIHCSITLNPILTIIETISLFNQPIPLAVCFTANITADHLLIHLIGSATLVLTSISIPTASITFTILFLLTILELAVALIQAYVFTFSRPLLTWQLLMTHQTHA